jgi:HemY protein
MADIEEADTGDQGRIRQWLARAVRAKRDPVWVADGVVSERWAPMSPVTGRLDAFEWKTPLERPLHLVEHDRDALPDAGPVLLPQVPVTARSAIDTETDEEAVIVEPMPGHAIDRLIDADKPAPAAANAPAPLEPEASPAQSPDEPARQLEPQALAVPAAANDSGAVAADDDGAVVPRPDDPGVDPTERDETQTRRFRLF